MKIEVNEDAVYRQFAQIYPHELYASDPERFWLFFHGECPDVPREQMERILEETATHRGKIVR
jgi:hypothetical protein